MILQLKKILLKLQCHGEEKVHFYYYLMQIMDFMKTNFIFLVTIGLIALSCENINEVDFKEAKELRNLDKYEESNRILEILVEKKYKLDSVYFYSIHYKISV